MTFNHKLPDTLNLLRSHTSIRKYKKEQIPIEVLKDILGSAQHAASSNFVQAYSVVLVSDEEKKEKLVSFLEINHRSIQHLFYYCSVWI